MGHGAARRSFLFSADSTPGRRLEVSRGHSLTRQRPQSWSPKLWPEIGGAGNPARVSVTWLPSPLTSLRPPPSTRHRSRQRTLRGDQEGLEIFILVTLPKWRGVIISVSLRIPCSAAYVYTAFSRYPNCPAPSNYAKTLLYLHRGKGVGKSCP